MPYNVPAHSVAQDPTPEKISGPTTIAATTFRQRDQWSRMIGRNPLVKLRHRNVLQTFALFAHLDGDHNIICNPTFIALGEAAQCSPRTANRALVVAERIGLVRKVDASNGRVASDFELLLPTVASGKSRVFNGAKAPEVSGSNHAKFEVPTMPNLDGNNAGARVPTMTSSMPGQEAKSKKDKIQKESKIERPKRPPAALVETQHLASNGNKSASDAAQSQALETCIRDTPSAPVRRLVSARVGAKEPTRTLSLAASCYPIPVCVTNGANGTSVDRNGEAATPELPGKAREAHSNSGLGPYVRQTGSSAITLAPSEIPTKKGAYREIDRIAHAARRPEEIRPHHKGQNHMPRIQSREEMFAKIKNFYPVIGLDDAINFEAFGLALDHGCDFYELFEEVLDQRSFSKDGQDVPPLAEFLVSKCWVEAIAA
jgi:hypothetical protein